MSDILSIVVINQRSEISRLCRMVERFGEEHGIAPDDVITLSLLLDETVINVIAHGYEDAKEHLINVHLELTGDLVTIRVDDDGVPFNPIEAPAPNLDLPIEERRIGGLGVHIVKTMADSVAYARVDGRNVLTLTKRISR
jgi:anti-sigma regulatory factor (Ser/Thr protein kinase)